MQASSDIFARFFFVTSQGLLFLFVHRNVRNALCKKSPEVVYFEKIKITNHLIIAESHIVVVIVRSCRVFQADDEDEKWLSVR